MHNNRIEVIDEITYLEVVEDNTTIEIVEEVIDIVEVGIQGPPGIGAPSAGMSGEVLSKLSDAYFDIGWTKNPFDIVQETYDANNNGIIDHAELADLALDSELVGGRNINEFFDKNEINFITARYTYSQPYEMKDWLIEHNLERYPSGITVVDSAGSIVEGAIKYISNNIIKVSFNYAFSGKAYIG